MCDQTRGHVLALVLTLLAAGTGYGQGTLGTPVAAGPDAPAMAPAAQQLWKVNPLGTPGSADPIAPTGPGCGGPAACIPYEDRNGSLLVGNPLLDYGPGVPGWIAGVELGVVVPHIKNRLTQDVTLSNGTTTTVHLPTANLGVRVMPRLEFGYRFGQAAGELIASYRFVTAQGSQMVSGTDLPPFAPGGAAVRSRLDLQILDLDYANYEPSLGPQWNMKWRIGARAMIAYSDSQGGNDVLQQQTTNQFWGIGPHASLDLRRWIGNTGLAVFGRLDTSLPIGRTTQRFIDIAPGAAGETNLHQNQPQFTLAGQLGVTWNPGRSDRFHVTAGYYYEHFWDTGSIGVFGNTTREEISLQGGFLRAAWNY